MVRAECAGGAGRDIFTGPHLIRFRRTGASREDDPLAVLSIALILAPAAAQQPALGRPADPLEHFDAYVRQAMEDWGGVGLAVAVVKDGEVVFQEGYGVRSLATGERMTPETMSGTASAVFN